MRLVKSMLVLAAVCGACSVNVVVQPTLINGRWAEVQSIPGNSETMTLTLNGTSVSGTGDWRGEAGPSGTLTVTGTLNGTTLVMDIVQSNGNTQHFEGNLKDANTLAGLVSDPANPSQRFPITFRRF